MFEYQKGLLTLGAIFLVVALIFTAFDESSEVETSRPVFICDSPNANFYYLDSLSEGLNQCTDQIVKISENDALKQGRSLGDYQNDF